uniref:RQC domain-containing protein n=1 Tax=Flavobacterium sp. TaxID=239 RepID=UPI00404AA9C7
KGDTTIAVPSKTKAGRDGGEGHCLAYYSYKDIEKLEKFMSGKPVAEQEVGFALLQEVVAYSETSISRRKYLLHYFGEEFDSETGDGADMDDNMRNPKEKVEAQDQVVTLLEVIRDTKQQFKAKDVIFALLGKTNAIINAHKIDAQPYFGKGKNFDDKFWMALIRQILVVGLIEKDIESYGVIRLTEKGLNFIKTPSSFMMSKDHEYNLADDDTIVSAKSSGVLDEALMSMLKDLRKKVAKKLGVPPFVVFQDPSLEDMALKYPISIEELGNVHGVGEGKAKKYGKDFISLIIQYVEDNDITRPDDLVVKSTGSNSGLKLYIIQNVDRKLDLNDLAKAKGLSMDDFIKEMEQIVYSGTKLNLKYWIDDILDEDQQEEIYDYFMDSQSDNIKDALSEFDGEYDIEELRLMRIKFISEVAN